MAKQAIFDDRHPSDFMLARLTHVSTVYLNAHVVCQLALDHETFQAYT